MISTLKLNQDQIRQTADNLYSVFDAIEFVAQKKNQRLVWKRLVEQYPEVVTNVTSFTFPRNKGRATPVTDKATIIEIISLLPGKVGGETRRAAIELLLKYIEAPEELALAALARVSDVDKVRMITEEATKKYLSKYHPLMGEIKKREGISPTTYQHVNTLNTKACMGAEPAVIKAERGGDTARIHATPEELGRLMVLQEMQCSGLRKENAQGHSEISKIVQLAADDFQAMLERYGVI
jgi:hypothetical protein